MTVLGHTWVASTPCLTLSTDIAQELGWTSALQQLAAEVLRYSPFKGWASATLAP
jgi:hypothetical protein